MNRLVKNATGEVLVQNLLVRSTFGGRLSGLLFYPQLEPGSAMLLVATKRVHTYGMRFPLDLYFFTGSLRLINTQRCILPWQAPKSPEATQHILEIQHRAESEPLGLNIGENVCIL